MWIANLVIGIRYITQRALGASLPVTKRNTFCRISENANAHYYRCSWHCYLYLYHHNMIDTSVINITGMDSW